MHHQVKSVNVVCWPKSRPAFTIRSLGIAIALIAALLAVPAYCITQIRAEANAALQLQIIADEEALALGEPKENVISWNAPQSELWRVLYRLAGSEGTVTRVDIRGDHSATHLLDHAGALPNIRHLRVVKEYKISSRECVTPVQIAAAARMHSLQELEFYANFAEDSDISPLGRIKTIGLLKIAASAIPFRVINQLGDVNAERLDIWYDETRPECVLPSEAFESFSRISCKHIRISGGIDDRGFELIAKAPSLEYLDINALDYLGSPNSITDSGMKRASKTMRASHLVLSCSAISDASIEPIAGMKNLQTVELTTSNISPEGFARLRTLRPDLTVRK